MTNFRAASGRTLFALAAASAAPFVIAQGSFTLPHVLEKDGKLSAVAWDVSGGQPNLSSATGFEHFSALYSFYDNDDFFAWLVANVNGKPTPATWDVFSLRKGRDRGWTVADMIPIEIRFPACDADSKLPDGLRAIGRITFKAKEGATLARSNVARKQKMWLPCNFRLKIGDLPTGRVNKIDSFTIKQQVADLDGDGAPDTAFYRADDLVIHLPPGDAEPFRAAYEATRSGKPTSYAVSLSFLDADGNPLLTYTNLYHVVGFGPSDPWMNPGDPDVTFRTRLLESIQDEGKGFSSLIR